MDSILGIVHCKGIEYSVALFPVLVVGVPTSHLIERMSLLKILLNFSIKSYQC